MIPIECLQTLQNSSTYYAIIENKNYDIALFIRLDTDKDISDAISRLHDLVRSITPVIISDNKEDNIFFLDSYDTVAI